MIKGRSDAGTVHEAKREAGRLVQVCGKGPLQRSSLGATEDAVTCRRCLARKPAAPAPAPRPAAPARKVSAPVTWGVFNADGSLRVIRESRTAARAAAEHIGFGCYADKVV